MEDPEKVFLRQAERELPNMKTDDGRIVSTFDPSHERYGDPRNRDDTYHRAGCYRSNGLSEDGALQAAKGVMPSDPADQAMILGQARTGRSELAENCGSLDIRYQNEEEQARALNLASQRNEILRNNNEVDRVAEQYTPGTGGGDY